MSEKLGASIVNSLQTEGNDLWRVLAVVTHLLQWAITISMAYFLQFGVGKSDKALSTAIEKVLTGIVMASPLSQGFTLLLVWLSLMGFVAIMLFGFPGSLYFAGWDCDVWDVSLGLLSFKYPFVGSYELAKCYGLDAKIVGAGSLVFYVTLWMPSLTGGYYVAG